MNKTQAFDSSQISLKQNHLVFELVSVALTTRILSHHMNSHAQSERALGFHTQMDVSVFTGRTRTHYQTLHAHASIRKFTIRTLILGLTKY